MKYGKIRLEDGNLLFVKHMIMNSLPCKDIVWAYMRKEGVESGEQKQLTITYLVILTKRKKRYKFDMTEKEVQDCLHFLKVLNPEIIIGYPKGGRIPLQSLPNTRDLGALMTKDGRHILPKRLIRSGSLYHVSILDQDTLRQEYHLSTVIDLRTNMERNEKTDTQLPYVEYYHIPILDEEAMETTYECVSVKNWREKGSDMEGLLLRQYENMICDEYSIKQFARFFDIVLRQENGSVLWHGGVGKDRVGVAAALLLCVLGVDLEDIKEDYMKTNVYLEEEFEHMIRFLETKMIVDSKTIESIKPLFRVKEIYLDKIFETIEKEYGSMDKFARRALYLSPKAIENLKDKYLI